MPSSQRFSLPNLLFPLFHNSWDNATLSNMPINIALDLTYSYLHNTSTITFKDNGRWYNDESRITIRRACYFSFFTFFSFSLFFLLSLIYPYMKTIGTAWSAPCSCLGQNSLADDSSAPIVQYNMTSLCGLSSREAILNLLRPQPGLDETEAARL